jgi:beta-xylosidase
MKKYIIAFYLVGMSGGLVSAQDYVSKVWVSDQGDGTYKNPVLYADYSDPDACRVGDDYYLTSSSFGFFQTTPVSLITHRLRQYQPIFSILHEQSCIIQSHYN